jgi:hypothetical protein
LLLYLLYCYFVLSYFIATAILFYYIIFLFYWIDLFVYIPKEIFEREGADATHETQRETTATTLKDADGHHRNAKERGDHQTKGRGPTTEWEGGSTQSSRGEGRYLWYI